MKYKLKTIENFIFLVVILLIIGIFIITMLKIKKIKEQLIISAKDYISSIEKEIFLESSGQKEYKLIDGTYDINFLTNNGVKLVDKQLNEGKVNINNYKVTWGTIVFKSYTITYNNGNYNISRERDYQINYKLLNNKRIKCNPKGIGEVQAIYFNPTSGTMCDIDEYHNNYNSYKYNFVGDVTELSTGCLKWYPYSDNDSSINLILDHNIKASNTNYADVDSILKEKTSYWKNYNARIIDKDELEKIIGVEFNNNIMLDSCSEEVLNIVKMKKNYEKIFRDYTLNNISIYQWLFNYTKCGEYGCRENSYSNDGYWIESSDKWYIKSDGSVVEETSNNKHGVRPVITISKDLFDSKAN